MLLAIVIATLVVLAAFSVNVFLGLLSVVIVWVLIRTIWLEVHGPIPPRS